MKPRATLAAVRHASQAARQAYKQRKQPSEHNGAGLARRLAARPKQAVTRAAGTVLPAARTNGREAARRPMSEPVRDERPDVLLDIPSLEVDELDLELDDLQARVALGAHVLELLELDVGADAKLGQVKLTLKGVRAQAQLQVRLDNVARILDRVMGTVDHNPAVLENLANGLGAAGGAIGAGAGAAAGELGRRAGRPSRQPEHVERRR